MPGFLKAEATEYKAVEVSKRRRRRRQTTQQAVVTYVLYFKDKESLVDVDFDEDFQEVSISLLQMEIMVLNFCGKGGPFVLLDADF